MNNHLSRCIKFPHNKKAQVDKRQRTLESLPSIRQRDGKSSSIITPHSFDVEIARKKFGRMIMLDEMPFKQVEREGFRDFISYCAPRFIWPSRVTVARDCYKLFVEEKKSLKGMFKKLSSHVSLTTDTWTSCQNLNYMCLTAHFIDNDWSLQKKIINFCLITSHSGEAIGKAVEKCLIEWGINRVFTITVDNASSNDVGLQYLKKRLNSWKGSVLKGEFLHMRCAAHILNLIVKEGLKELEDSIRKIRSAVRYVRSSPARMQRFKSCVEKERIESKSLVCLDVETRWNSTYLMLESAVKFQKAFDLLETTDSKYVEELSKHREGLGVPNDIDWDYAKNLLPFLKIFYETTLRLSGSQYVTGNMYMKEIFGLGMMLSRKVQSGDIGACTMASRMKKKYDKYWGNVDQINIMLFIAVILDPRCKLGYVEWVIADCYEVEIANRLCLKVKETLNLMFEAYGSIVRSPLQSNNEIGIIGDGMEVMEVESSATGSQFMDNLYTKVKVNQGLGDSKSELEKYLGEECENSRNVSFDILNWWKITSSKYPILSSMARDVLAMPVSTVASESAFSTGGRLLDSFRSSLNPKMVEALICGQDWLRRSHLPIQIEENMEEMEKIETGMLLAM